MCRTCRATLPIAKLDRLARSVAFISNLREGGVDFVAADMPSVNRLTAHVLAAVAEHEREMASQRTKAALAAAKVRGTRLGNPRLPPGRHAGRRAVPGHSWRSGASGSGDSACVRGIRPSRRSGTRCRGALAGGLRPGGAPARNPGRRALVAAVRRARAAILRHSSERLP